MSTAAPLRAGLALVLLASGGLAARALAEPRVIAAQVVWVRDDRVYLASRDSSAFDPGMRLTFLDRRREVASGEIVSVHDGELALARLSGGSLARVRRLDRLRVLGERREPRPLPVLRVGYPSPRRANLLFSCAGVAVDGPPAPGFSAPESLAADAFRAVREASAAGGVAGADTLIVRLFDDATDQEIALERGELDVGIFWPGELSPHMREDPRWQELLYGRRERGLLAAIPGPREVPPAADAPPSPVPAEIAALNQRLFRGDLEPWTVPDDPRDAPAPPPRWPERARYAADSGMPGRPALERFLNRGAAEAASLVRLLYLDLPVAPASALRDSLRARGATPLFALRCPVVCRTELRAQVHAFGTDRLVNAIGCRAPGGAR